MPRDPGDAALQQTYPAEFEARANEYGWTVESLPDAEFRQIASEILRANVGDLYNRAMAADGAGLDVSANPQFAARLGATGATQAQARAFAEGLYPDLTPQQAVARYNRDVQRASGAKVDEPRDLPFDRVF